MKYLLDTSVFLVALTAPQKLRAQALDVLATQREGIFLSAASSWEIAIKHALGRLDLPDVPARYIPACLARKRISALDVTHFHALSVGDLPEHHHDPIDRLLIAQARLEGMVLLTNDRMFERYKVETLWCGR